MKAAFLYRLVVKSLLVCILAGAVLGAVLFLGQPRKAYAATAMLAESNQTALYTQSQLASKGIGGYTDGEMGVWQNGSNYSFLGSDSSNGTHSTITTGTLDDPIQTVNAHLSIQNVPSGFNYVSAGPVYQDSGTGDLLTFVHLERWPNGDWTKFWGSLGLAISKDGGASWAWCGEIIQHNDPYSNSLQSGEEVSSGSFVIVNGYFYVYTTDWDTNHNPGIAVVRAPVSDVVNAAQNNQVTSWSKYENGAWNSPGLGGGFTNVLGRPYGGEEDISYNTYLNEYILGINYGDNQGHYWISLLASDNPLAFSQATYNNIAYRSGGYSQYPTIVGTGTNPQYNSGQTFYVYYITWGSDGVFGSQMNLSRSTITASSGTPANSYQASAGFSSTQGQNQWSYQYSTDGEQSFQNLNWDATDNTWVDPSGFNDYCDIWQNSQHPNGSSCDSARVWTAPSSGTVTLGANGPLSVVSGSYCGGNTSGVNIRILKNGTQIWPSAGWQNIPNGGSYVFPGGVSIPVTAGDHIQFVDAHAGSVNYCDSTTWDQVVTYSSFSGTGSYQASTGFSSTQGQNRWSYQYSTNGDQSFQNLSWDGTNNAWDGPGGYYGFCDVTSNWQIPNTSCDAARVWQAPQAGTVTLSSNGALSVQTACGGNNNGTQIRILKNGSQIWPSSGWQSLAHGASYNFPAGVTTSVNTGDQIQFVISYTGSDNYCDVTTWDQIVSYN